MLGMWMRRGAVVFSALAISVGSIGQKKDATEWQVVAPARETGCGFDTPFEFWVREGDPTRLLIYLQGGGACWNHETCHPDRRLRFRRAVDPTDDRERRDGIFDRSSPANPFRDHTVVFVPYCTGDFHLGARRVTYEAPPGSEAGDITVNHAGSHNVRAVLRHLAGRSVTPQMVVVTGGSAGAAASPLVAAQAARLFPDAAIRQIGDGAGGLRSPEIRGLLQGWGAEAVLAARGLPLPADGDPLTAMYLAAAARHPRIRFAQVNTSEDATVADGLRMFGQAPERVAANVAETYAELRAAGICFSGYVLPGTQHTLLWRPDFLTASVDGRPLAAALARDVLDRPCPAPLEIWFVRHAESEFNMVQGPLPVPDQGVSYPLTARGVQQAVQLGRSFAEVPVRHIYSSTRLRALQTADAMSFQSGVPVTLAPEAVEIDFGPAPDLREARALGRRWLEGDVEARLRGQGENLREVRARFLPFWERLVARHGEDTGVLVLVTHGGIIMGVLPELCEELTLEEAMQRGIGNAQVVRTRLQGGALRCDDWHGGPSAAPPGG